MQSENNYIKIDHVNIFILLVDLLNSQFEDFTMLLTSIIKVLVILWSWWTSFMWTWLFECRIRRSCDQVMVVWSWLSHTSLSSCPVCTVVSPCGERLRGPSSWWSAELSWLLGWKLSSTWTVTDCTASWMSPFLQEYVPSSLCVTD